MYFELKKKKLIARHEGESFEMDLPKKNRKYLNHMVKRMGKQRACEMYFDLHIIMTKTLLKQMMKTNK